MLELTMIVLSTVGVCTGLFVLVPQGNLIALTLLGFGFVNLGVLIAHRIK